jgi:hypothetical protein
MHINFRDKNLLLYSIKLVTSGDNFSQELFRLLVKRICYAHAAKEPAVAHVAFTEMDQREYM